MIKLTSLSSCAGCAAKLPQDALREVLRVICRNFGIEICSSVRPRPMTLAFFVSIATAPLCKPSISSRRSWTIRIFYGQIAATNAISDVYAMGGRPLTALNLLGIPADKISPQIVQQILLGGVEKAKEANCVVVGGHTIRTPEPIYGMAVTGLVSPEKLLTNAKARAGDLLVLTKPLGTGIVTTGIKRALTSRGLAKKTIALMCRLNSLGAVLAERDLVRAAVDITGFGLLGHLASMCRASKVSAEISPAAVPAISREIFSLIEKDCIPGGSRQNLETADDIPIGMTRRSRCVPFSLTPKPAGDCCYAFRKSFALASLEFCGEDAHRPLQSSAGSFARGINSYA